MKKLSIIVSVYNEEEGIEEFYRVASEYARELFKKGWLYEFVFVNDGSGDSSYAKLYELAKRDVDYVKLISFSRNFGHEAAMTAGLDYGTGDALVFMDADLQHPPEYLSQIVDSLNEGYQVISMVRTKNPSAGILKNISSALFYKMINRLSKVHFETNASDFFAISREVQEILKTNYREKVRFLRGYIQNVGFQRTSISYEARERVAGSSHYSISKLMSFSVNAIMCFSNMPLKLGIYAGLMSALLGISVLIYTLCTRGGAPSGYATIVVLNCFMFSILFLIVGIIGEYISVLFEELKDRPIYIIENKVNL